MHLKLTLALLSSLLALALGGFLPIPKPPSMPGMGSIPVVPKVPLEEDDIERVVFPCYRDAHCALGPEAKLEMGKCVDKFPRRDQDQMIGTMNKIGYSTEEMGSDSVRVVTQNYFCNQPQDVMKTVFTDTVRGLIEFLTETCPTNPQICAISDKAVKCITERIAIHQAAGQCLPED